MKVQGNTHAAKVQIYYTAYYRGGGFRRTKLFRKSRHICIQFNLKVCYERRKQMPETLQRLVKIKAVMIIGGNFISKVSFQLKSLIFYITLKLLNGGRINKHQLELWRQLIPFYCTYYPLLSTTYLLCLLFKL